MRIERFNSYAEFNKSEAGAYIKEHCGTNEETIVSDLDSQIKAIEVRYINRGNYEFFNVVYFGEKTTMNNKACLWFNDGFIGELSAEEKQFLFA